MPHWKCLKFNKRPSFNRINILLRYLYLLSRFWFFVSLNLVAVRTVWILVKFCETAPSIINFFTGISCVQFDDTRIASGSYDKTIRVWDIKSDDSDVVLTLAGHSGTVRCLNLNGNRLVSGSVDRSIKVSSMLHFCSFVLWFWGQMKEGHSLSTCPLHICTLYLVQTQVQSKDSDVDVG